MISHGNNDDSQTTNSIIANPQLCQAPMAVHHTFVAGLATPSKLGQGWGSEGSARVRKIFLEYGIIHIILGKWEDHENQGHYRSAETRKKEEMDSCHEEKGLDTEEAYQDLWATLQNRLSGLNLFNSWGGPIMIPSMWTCSKYFCLQQQ